MVGSSGDKRKLLFVMGTRPEAIKLAPVILAARAVDRFDVRVCATAQHREMLDQVLANFSIVPDIDLDVMTVDQQPATVASQVTAAMASVFAREKPHWAIVQGDTTSTFAASLAAFYARVPVAHVEAGLRTHDLTAPWPEEMNRRLTTALATLHFAPTERARNNLLREGVPSDAIELTGNTVVDAVMWISERLDENKDATPSQFASTRFILVTAHRRENLGAPLASILEGLRGVVDRVPDVMIVIVAHRNPNVRAALDAFKAGVGRHDRIHVIDPVDYAAFIDLIRRSELIITDSGGIQEEAPIFGTPVLVLRDVTERPEAIEHGGARLVGAHADTIRDEALRILGDAAHRASMSRKGMPFGDGHAAQRIIRRLGIV